MPAINYSWKVLGRTRNVPNFGLFFQLPNLRIARLEKMTLPEINGKNWRGILCDVRVPLAW